MAKQGKVVLLFECMDCQEKIRVSLFFGEKKIWNNSTSQSLQKLKPHEKHNVRASCQFEQAW